MATKAELFRQLVEREASKRRAERARTRSDARPAEERRDSSRAARKAPYALEQSAGRRSRKSTRRSANRQKNDVQFRMKRRVSEARAQDRPRTPR